MRRRRYRWWVERMRRASELFDVVRIDHFRGLVAYWAVPAGARSAAAGKWRRGPGGAPLAAARREVRGLQVIAEDLGVITPPVEQLRRRLRIPGMAVLQFLFDRDEDASSGDAAGPAGGGGSGSRGSRAAAAGGSSAAAAGASRGRAAPGATAAGASRGRTAPGASEIADPVGEVGRDRLLYTGTHDQDTLMGWWGSLDHRARAPVEQTLRARGLRGGGPWPLVRLAASAPAAVMMVQMQDLLGLGSEARMNTPGRAAGNWSWRMPAGAADARLARRLREACEEAGRAGGQPR